MKRTTMIQMDTNSEPLSPQTLVDFCPETIPHLQRGDTLRLGRLWSRYGGQPAEAVIVKDDLGETRFAIQLPQPGMPPRGLLVEAELSL